MHVGFHGPVSSQNVRHNGMLLPEFCFAVIRKESFDRHDFLRQCQVLFIRSIVEFYFSFSIKICFIVSGHISGIHFFALSFSVYCRTSSFNPERGLWRDAFIVRKHQEQCRSPGIVSGKMLTKRPFRVDTFWKRRNLLHTINIHFLD